MGTPEQHLKISQLQSQGYKWDKNLSISYAGVVLTKGKDLWVFDLVGGIHHNPESISVLTR